MYKVVIVEDETHQLERLISLLTEHHNDLEVSGIARSINEAERILEKVTPDLVFLDVMLPPFTSFDLLARIGQVDFEIIFTTSFEEFAVKAFRLCAIDYLIKPLVATELTEAVEKFRSRKGALKQTDHLSVLLKNFELIDNQKKKIALPSLSGYTFVSIGDIVRCESDNTYTTFFLRDKRKIIVSKTLKECETLLNGYSFFRIHNSNLVNMNMIEEYERGEGGRVKMIDGSRIDVSRRKKEEFIKLFKKIGA